MRIREVDLADEAELTRLLEFEAVHGSPRVRTIAERRATFPPEWSGILLAAEDARGELVGSAAGHVMPMMVPGSVQVNGFVRHGLGPRVLGALMDHIAEWQPADAEPALVAHVIDRTAEEHARWIAVGFIAAGERTRLARAVVGADRDLAVATPEGVHIESLADHPQLEAAASRVWFAAHADIPSVIPFDPTTDATLRDDIGVAAGDELPRTLLVALDDAGDIAGVAYLHLHEDERTAAHRFTGVAPQWRGRGVARCLKGRLIALAAGLGVEELVASNDADNAAMRAINDAFGYQPRYTIAMYRRP